MKVNLTFSKQQNGKNNLILTEIHNVVLPKSLIYVTTLKPNGLKHVYTK